MKRGTKVRSVETGRTGQVLNSVSGNCLYVEWDGRGARNVVPADRLEPVEMWSCRSCGHEAPAEKFKANADRRNLFWCPECGSGKTGPRRDAGSGREG